MLQKGGPAPRGGLCLVPTPLFGPQNHTPREQTRSSQHGAQRERQPKEENATWGLLSLSPTGSLKMKRRIPGLLPPRPDAVLSHTLLAVGASVRRLPPLFCMFWQDYEEARSPKNQRPACSLINHQRKKAIWRDGGVLGEHTGRNTEPAVNRQKGPARGVGGGKRSNY